MFQRAPENRPRIQGELAQSSLLQSLVGDQASRIVEKQNPQRFVVERTHRGDEIAPEFWAERIDRDGTKISGHSFEGSLARADYERNDRRDVTEDTTQCFRRRRPNPADALEFVEEDLG